METIMGWKVFTHDLRSPIWRNEPIWDGQQDFLLPQVDLDESEQECGSGWHFCRELSTALLMVGLWPDGHPSRPYVVETEGKWVERGKTCRGEQLHILRPATAQEIEEAINEFSACFGRKHQQGMTEEQLTWRAALGGPARDEKIVKAALESALRTQRLLHWDLERLEDARSVQVAWEAWVAQDRQSAQEMQGIWTPWSARVAWDECASPGARSVRFMAWGTWWHQPNPRDMWAALAAKNALTTTYIIMKGESSTTDSSGLRTLYDSYNCFVSSLRKAYYYGLAVALPIAPDKLGWAIDGIKQERP